MAWFGGYKGIGTVRISLFVIVLILQAFQLYIALHIIQALSFKSFLSLVLEVHAHHTLACQCAYSLSKTPSRFYQKSKILYYSYVKNISFLQRNSKLLILTKHPKFFADHCKSVEALQSCKSFKQKHMILCQIHAINFAYKFLSRGS